MIKNICLVDTPFALSLYLLKMPLDEIMCTKFITSGSISKMVTDMLPNRCIVYENYEPSTTWQNLLKVRIDRFIRFPYIYWSKVYAQDHLSLSAQVIGKKQYTLIADTPNGFYNWSVCAYQPHDFPIGSTWRSKIKNMLVYGGTMFGKMYGTNNQCVQRWLVGEGEENTVYVKGRTYEIVDVQDLWEKASFEKKILIQSIFHVSDDLLNKAKEADTIILTQPFREDCSLSDEEFINIYKPYINQETKVVIKPHPRDKFDWEKNFPNTIVLRTPAPMQLLNYMGVRPQCAITVCSTSIYAMPENVKRLMLGTKINKKILDTYGELFN